MAILIGKYARHEKDTRRTLRTRVSAMTLAVVTMLGLLVSPGPAMADNSSATTYCGRGVVEQGSGSWREQFDAEVHLYYDENIRRIAEKFEQGTWVCVPARWAIEMSVEALVGGGAQRVLLVRIPQFNRLVKLAYGMATQHQTGSLPAVGARYLHAPVSYNQVRVRTAPVDGPAVKFLNYGDSVWILCQSMAFDGTLWDQVALSPGGRPSGWVADRLVYTGTNDQVTASC